MVSTALANAIVTGLVTGSVIALGAIGLSLVYSIAEVPNFAHGELLMLGAYVALLVNRPATVPLYKLLATDTQAVSLLGLFVLFAIVVAALLGIVYLLSGRAGLEGDWWPVDVSPTVGLVGHLAAASALGGLVLLATPSIVGGMLLAIIVMAALSPLQETIVYRQFRDKGVDLVTMLIVALGLSFVLRYGTQAIFGGAVRAYQIPNLATVFGVRVPLSAAQFFDVYVDAGGVVVEMINTGVVGAQAQTVAVIGWGWARLVGVAVLTAAAAAVAYRLRSGERSTFGPRIAAAVAGVVAFVVAGFVLGTSANVPGAPLYSTRISLSLMRGIVVVIALAMMGVLHVLLQETKLGTAMRASSDNLDLARITGIDTDRVMIATWMIAGAYGAIGGVMLGILFASITPNVGFFLLLPMFAGAILGGVGSVYGAILGSYLVGLSMDVGIYLFNIETTYRVPIAFVVLFVVLLVKPEGIAGGN